MFSRHLLKYGVRHSKDFVVVSQNSPLANWHFENMNNFTTAERLIGKRHPMSMSTLTTNKLL